MTKLTTQFALASLALTLAAFIATPALACRAPSMETYVVLPAPPKNVPKDAVVLRVGPLTEEDIKGDGVAVETAEPIVGKWPYKFLRLRLPPPTSCSRRVAPKDYVYVVGRPGANRGQLNVIEYRLNDLQDVRDQSSQLSETGPETRAKFICSDG